MTAPQPPDPPSAAKLLRATIGAVGLAAFLLTTVVLPAEYGVDPTGLGRVLGLTPMGAIKRRLAEEAAADAAADAAAIAEQEAAALPTDTTRGATPAAATPVPTP